MCECSFSRRNREIQDRGYFEFIRLFSYNVTNKIGRENAAHFLYELFRDNKYLTMKENMN